MLSTCIMGNVASSVFGPCPFLGMKSQYTSESQYILSLPLQLQGWPLNLSLKAFWKCSTKLLQWSYSTVKQIFHTCLKGILWIYSSLISNILLIATLLISSDYLLVIDKRITLFTILLSSSSVGPWKSITFTEVCMFKGLAGHFGKCVSSPSRCVLDEKISTSFLACCRAIASFRTFDSASGCD